MSIEFRSRDLEYFDTPLTTAFTGGNFVSYQLNELSTGVGESDVQGDRVGWDNLHIKGSYVPASAVAALPATVAAAGRLRVIAVFDKRGNVGWSPSLTDVLEYTANVNDYLTSPWKASTLVDRNIPLFDRTYSSSGPGNISSTPSVDVDFYVNLNGLFSTYGAGAGLVSSGTIYVFFVVENDVSSVMVPQGYFYGYSRLRYLSRSGTVHPTLATQSMDVTNGGGFFNYLAAPPPAGVDPNEWQSSRRQRVGESAISTPNGTPGARGQGPVDVTQETGWARYALGFAGEAGVAYAAARMVPNVMAMYNQHRLAQAVSNGRRFRSEDFV